MDDDDLKGEGEKRVDVHAESGGWAAGRDINDNRVTINIGNASLHVTPSLAPAALQVSMPTMKEPSPPPLAYRVRLSSTLMALTMIPAGLYFRADTSHIKIPTLDRFIETVGSGFLILGAVSALVAGVMWWRWYSGRSPAKPGA